MIELGAPHATSPRVRTAGITIVANAGAGCSMTVLPNEVARVHRRATLGRSCVIAGGAGHKRQRGGIPPVPRPAGSCGPPVARRHLAGLAFPAADLSSSAVTCRAASRACRELLVTISTSNVMIECRNGLRPVPFRIRVEAEGIMLMKRRCERTGVINFFSDAEPLLAAALSSRSPRHNLSGAPTSMTVAWE